MTDISDDELVRYLDAFDDWARANPIPDDTVTRIPGFVSAMGDAADAAIRQGIPYEEAVRRAEFALYAEYEAAGLPTCWILEPKEDSDVQSE